MFLFLFVLKKQNLNFSSDRYVKKITFPNIYFPILPFSDLDIYFMQ